ncbi:patatin-like phospholipase family protein [Novilysobacter spongiicola]|uniref:Patatin-like phospholipase/acyl hydrolase n=1 Tax=Lysobacter spongiicola DSM 21749 TaxID=1122188 RepID=A0A1T4LPP5_9GAMM|nr:patatin-like phospholipase family protein [Lysobacter spongiicola]SJZ56596.1 Patatin-like phospholipase/acyl hydrolase [Lysobacter spongiicola DSM 21749]
MEARRILSIDGGGIRGLVSCTWLGGVEDALAQAGKPGLLANFDLMAGSSTGALVACGLGLGLAPDALAELYRARSAEIFPGMASRLWSRASRFLSAGPSAPKYDGRGLERVLRDVFGDATLGQLQLPTLITSYDTISRKPLIFKSFKASHRDLPIREVCRASTAAPTYFPAHPMDVDGLPRSLIDGGIVANNPTACAIAEALRHDREVIQCGDLVVLSVGTGERNRPIPLQSAREWGAVEWAIPIIDVLFDGNTDSVDYITRHLVGEGYFRMQAELLVGLDDLDDTSATNVAALDAMARDYLERDSTRRKLEALVTRL